MRSLLIAIAVLGGAAVAACGSSNQSSSAASGDYSQGVKYSDCMRSHGVSNFPDPSPAGGFNVLGLGGESNSPAFASAQTACAKLQPGGPAESQPITGKQLQQMAAKTRCIRHHGVPDFPDPTLATVGTPVDVPPDWNPEAPAAVTARRACAHVGIPIPGAGAAWFGPVG